VTLIDLGSARCSLASRSQFRDAHQIDTLRTGQAAGCSVRVNLEAVPRFQQTPDRAPGLKVTVIRYRMA
jgi:hypothetical protein